MSRLLLLSLLGAALACAGSEEAADSPDEATASTIALADVAGTWTLRAMAEGSDSVITTYGMVATDNMEGWTMTFPDRDPVPMRVVAVDGDSIVAEAGPYESVLRAGVMVSLRSVSRLQGDMMTGTFVARYETSEADSVLNGRFEGERSMN